MTTDNPAPDVAPAGGLEPDAWLYHKPGGTPLASTGKTEWQFGVEPLYTIYKLDAARENALDAMKAELDAKDARIAELEAEIWNLTR